MKLTFWILLLVAALAVSPVSAAPVSDSETPAAHPDVIQPESVQANAVRISQVYGGGGGSGFYKNDYVELFNAGTTSALLTGWSLQYGSATGNYASSATNLSRCPQARPSHRASTCWSSSVAQAAAAARCRSRPT